MSSLFVKIFDFLQRNKIIFWLLFLGSLLFFGIAATQIKLKQELADMLPESEALAAIHDVASQTQVSERILFFIENKNASTDILIESAEKLATTLQDSKYFDTVLVQPGAAIEEEILSVVQRYAPILQDVDWKQVVDKKLQSENLQYQLSESKRVLQSPASVYLKNMIAQDPMMLHQDLWQKLQSINIDEGFVASDGYLFADSGRLLLFYGMPHKAYAQEFYKQWDEIITKTSLDSVVEVYRFGGPLVAAANADQMKWDTVLTLSITIILLLLITVYYFRSVLTPLMIFIAPIYGALFSLGIIALIKGQLSIMAVGAGAIVLGIALDFSVHYLSHVRHTGQARLAVKELAKPLTIGSITTVLAFIVLMLTQSPILRDFGLFAGLSLVGAIIGTLIFLPHLLPENQVAKPLPILFKKLGSWQPEKSKWLVLVILLLTPFFYYWTSQVRFDADMMKLNFMSDELKLSQSKLEQVSPGMLQHIYVLAKGSDEEEALQNLEKVQQQIQLFIADQKISKASLPTDFMPSHHQQNQRAHAWVNYWQPLQQQYAEQQLQHIGSKEGFSKEAFSEFFNQIQEKPKLINVEDVQFLKQLYPAGFLQKGKDHYVVAQLKVPEEHREEVIHAFQHQQNIVVADGRTAAEQTVSLIQTDFNKVALWSSLIVFFALLIAYGRVELAMISFLPMAISWIWILGFMGILGIPFNVVNIILATLIFGLGDDYSIFTMDSLVERYKNGKQTLVSTRSAIYLSAITTIIGLGVLIFAKHPALQSISWIAVPGLIFVLLISQVLQPFLFNFLIQSRAQIGQMPFTFVSFLRSVIVFTNFVFGSLLLTLIGLILIPFSWIMPKMVGRFLRWCIQKYTWFVMYLPITFKKKVVFVGGQHQFKTPAIYIANHSSFLDILGAQMLIPNVVLLTKKWVWQSPIFGKLVRMASYYSVENGAEEAVETLNKLKNDRCNIFVFPEGTRSSTDKIARFKKGAFFLAESLKLPIVPIVFHGYGYGMRKGDWLLKNAYSTAYFYPAIDITTGEWGKDVKEVTKNIAQFMRSELAGIKERNETPRYFKEQLAHSYKYKGPVLEWYQKIKTASEGYYEDFHQLISREGKVYDLGCGNGFMAYLLAWSAPGREVLGYDYDDEKIATAQHVYVPTPNVNFFTADITTVEIKEATAIFLLDVLHYLPKEKQDIVLNNALQGLLPGGKLIIRDGVSELMAQRKGTALSEWWSTKILGFNKVEHQLTFISQKHIENIALEHHLTLEIKENSSYTANLTFILTKNKS